MRLSRTTYVTVFLVSLAVGYVVVGAGSHSSANPRPRADATVRITPDYPNRTVFDDALLSVHRDNGLTTKRISGMVVNHHLLAAQFIADTLQYAQGQHIDRIILLAPNHYAAGHGAFITTSATFATPYGDVQTDQQFVTNLVANGMVVNTAEPFQQEHGVYNILPFVRKIFPGVPIVPIITRDGTSIAQVDALQRQLASLTTAHTLVIASLDFAHNQTNEGAQVLDQSSIAMLSAVNPNTVQPNLSNMIQVDSPMTLRLFLGLMRDVRMTHFFLTHHSNSALETGHLDATDVTSHITGTYSRFF